MIYLYHINIYKLKFISIFYACVVYYVKEQYCIYNKANLQAQLLEAKKGHRSDMWCHCSLIINVSHELWVLPVPYKAYGTRCVKDVMSSEDAWTPQSWQWIWYEWELFDIQALGRGWLANDTGQQRGALGEILPPAPPSHSWPQRSLLVPLNLTVTQQQ